MPTPMTRQAPQLTDAEITDYTASVAAMTDDELVTAASRQIYLAGFDRLYGKADQRVSVCYKDAERRGKPWLYARAYNQAARDADIPLDQHDLDRARAPLAA